MSKHGLAACLPEDADNVYVVLKQRDLNPNLHIVARAVEEQAEPKLIRAGNRVVAPTIIGGHRMAVALTKPAVRLHRFGDCQSADLGFEQPKSITLCTLRQEVKDTTIRSERTSWL